MNGKTAKRLRRLSERKHLQAVASRALQPPDDWTEARAQLRKIYRLGKKHWKSISSPKSLLSVDLSLSSRPRLRERWSRLENSGEESAKQLLSGAGLNVRRQLLLESL